MSDTQQDLNGALAIVINKKILDDDCPAKGNGYNPGEIVTSVWNRDELGSKDKTTPHFTIIEIKDITPLAMAVMTEELRENGEFIERRKRKIDIDHVRVKGKTVLELADLEAPDVIITKELPIAPRPPEIQVG